MQSTTKQITAQRIPLFPPLSRSIRRCVYGLTALIGCLLSSSCTTIFLNKCDVQSLLPETPLVIVDTLSKNRLSLAASLGINADRLVSRDTSGSGMIAYYKALDTSNHDMHTSYSGFNYLDSADIDRDNLFWHVPRNTASLSASMNLWNIVSGLANVQAGYLSGMKWKADIGLALHYRFDRIAFQANGIFGIFNTAYTVSYIADESAYDMGHYTVALYGRSRSGHNVNFFTQVNYSMNTTACPWVNYLLNIGWFQARYLSIPSEPVYRSQDYLTLSPGVFTTFNRSRLILSADLIIDDEMPEPVPFLRATMTVQRLFF